jgi:acyl-CoA dehydrogenase
MVAKTDPDAARAASAPSSSRAGLRPARTSSGAAPLATLTFSGCTIGQDALVGNVNGGFKLAMQTLDIFRASVAAAALGMARRAFAEAVQHSKTRKMFGQTLADFQLTQAKLAQMATTIDSAALLTYRAAWQRDRSSISGAGTPAYTAAAASAKLTATENAQKVIDMALQMFGGRGVQVGNVIEHLYRDIRSLRIYEGASEVQLVPRQHRPLECLTRRPPWPNNTLLPRLTVSLSTTASTPSSGPSCSTTCPNCRRCPSRSTWCRRSSTAPSPPATPTDRCSAAMSAR